MIWLILLKKNSLPLIETNKSIEEKNIWTIVSALFAAKHSI